MLCNFPGFFAVRDVDEAIFDQRLILSRFLLSIPQYVHRFEIRTSIRFYEAG